LRPVELRPAERRPMELRLNELRPDELRPDELRFAEVSPVEVCRAEIRPAEIRPPEIRLAKRRLAEVRFLLPVFVPPLVPGIDALLEKSDVLWVRHGEYCGALPRATAGNLPADRFSDPSAVALRGVVDAPGSSPYAPLTNRS